MVKLVDMSKTELEEEVAGLYQWMTTYVKYQLEGTWAEKMKDPEHIRLLKHRDKLEVMIAAKGSD